MKKSIFLFLVVLIIFILFVETKIILFNDFSTMRIDEKANPDFKRNGEIKKDPVYLVSYADGAEIFFMNQNTLTASAMNRGIDFFFNYRRSHLDKDFIEKHKDILNQKKGAGYWLWKPWIILNTLKQVPENSIVIYADSGLVFKQSLQEAILDKFNKDVLITTYPPKVGGYAVEGAKKDLFIKLDCDVEACWHGFSTWAAFIVVRNTQKARDFIAEWLDLGCDPQLITDAPSKAPNHPEQKNHMHDQAILTVLYNRKVVIDKVDYIQTINSDELGKLAFWHHRHPNKNLELESLWQKFGNKINGFERIFILNSFIMKKLRQYFLNW
jgi:hypothetical protein